MKIMTPDEKDKIKWNKIASALTKVKHEDPDLDQHKNEKSDPDPDQHQNYTKITQNYTKMYIHYMIVHT